MEQLAVAYKRKTLWEKIDKQEAKVAVIGLGYVGLPHALHYANEGFEVVGIDVSTEKIAKLNEGVSYIGDIDHHQVKVFIQNNQVTSTYEKLSECDVILIDVPTPIDDQNKPDMQCLKIAAEAVRAAARQDQLIILESTSYPTTTKEYLIDPLAADGWTIGEDIFVAFSPERIDPGNQKFSIHNTPKLVGGATPACTNLAKQFIGKNAVTVSSPEVAELSKLYENTFRFVNIGLADELSRICDTMHISTNEVLEAADTKPFGFMKFHPATKIGGHCIGVDPYYLKWYMEEKELATPMLQATIETDQLMLDFVSDRILRILSQERIPSYVAKIAILGVTYKKNISDLRLSAAPQLVEKLQSYGAEVTLYDPHVSSIRIQGFDQEVLPPLYEELAEQDLVVILTDHDAFDYDQIARHAKVVFDTKGVQREEDNWHSL